VMPPKGKGERLKPEQVDVLVRWVKQGAVWPDGASRRLLSRQRRRTGPSSCRFDPSPRR